MMKPQSALTLLSVSAALLVPVGAGDVLAFVPACTEEVAAHYPPILRSDLSACSVASEPRPEPGLQARTVHGIVVKANSRVHVDLDRVSDRGGQGASVTLECADASCTNPTLVAGSMLDFALTGDRVVLTTQAPVVEKGLVSAAANTTPATAARFRFFQQAGVFVAIDERDRGQAAERKWDRVVLTDRTLTYISCKDGRVDRYVKSSPRSQISNTTVEQFLRQAQVRTVSR
jgi:hypothetical protein